MNEFNTGVHTMGTNVNVDLGPLTPLIADPHVSEVMVNGLKGVFVERAGKLERAPQLFKTPEDLNKIVLSVSRLVGKELSRKNPFLDARLNSNLRINIVVPPVAAEGALITIRKIRSSLVDFRALIQSGMLNEKALYFLNSCVANRLNVIVSGGTSSGKTTLLAALIGLIPKEDRLVVIEDSLELPIRHENTARMEARGSSAYDEGIDTRSLVKNALRMRPDRIIIGECRSGETWDMITAMNTGHEGSMTTIHANSGRETIRRIEALILTAEGSIPPAVIKGFIGNTLNLVVQIERTPQGKRRVSEILEVCGYEDEQILMQRIFKFDNEKGLISTNKVPLFCQNPKKESLKFPANFFDENQKVVVQGF